MRSNVFIVCLLLLLGACKDPEDVGKTMVLEQKLPITTVQATKLSGDRKTFCGRAMLTDGTPRLFYAGLVENRVYIEGEYGFTLEGYELRCDIVMTESEKEVFEKRTAERATIERQTAANSAAESTERQWLQDNQDAIHVLHKATQQRK